jgi:hypothetical protein
MAFDRNNPDDLLALKNEVNLDPLGAGYAAVIDDTQALLALLNNTQPGTITMDKLRISAAEVRSLTTFNGYDTLSIDEQEWLRWKTGSNSFDEENLAVTVDLKLQLTGKPLISDPRNPPPDTPNSSFWAASQRAEMVPLMLALVEIPASRAQELFGVDTNITTSDWVAARNS